MEHRVKVTVLDNGISRAVQSYFFDMTNRNLCFLLTGARWRQKPGQASTQKLISGLPSTILKLEPEKNILTEASKREILAYGNRTDGRQKRAGRIRPGENGSNEWLEPVTDEVYGL